MIKFQRHVHHSSSITATMPIKYCLQARVFYIHRLTFSLFLLCNTPLHSSCSCGSALFTIYHCILFSIATLANRLIAETFYYY